MRLYWVLFAFLANACNLEPSSKAPDAFNHHMGRLTTECLHAHGPFNDVDTGGNEIDGALSDVKTSGDWDRFNYPQKRDYVLAALLVCRLGEGGTEILTETMGQDGERIIADLRGVPEDYLRQERFLNENGIEMFHNRLEVLGVH